MSTPEPFVPTNSYMALMIFFSSEKKPLSHVEMDEFWNSLTPSEKHYYMCADIGDMKTGLMKKTWLDKAEWEWCAGPMAWFEEKPELFEDFGEYLDRPRLTRKSVNGDFIHYDFDINSNNWSRVSSEESTPDDGVDDFQDIETD